MAEKEIAAEIEERAARTARYGKKADSGPDYLRIAAEQRDNAPARAAERNPLDFTFEVSVERVRRMGQIMAKASQIEEFGQKQAEAFLLLYGKQLEEKFRMALRDFIKEKLSK